jgi:hypothetical protein
VLHASPVVHQASALSTIGALGLGSVIGAVVAAVIGGFLTSRRERTSARRSWLAEALERFYGPVSAKLEMRHEWDTQLWNERQAKPREPDETVRYTEIEQAVIRRSVQANIKVHQDVRAIIEHSLHYVDEPELRHEALAFLANSYVDDWKRASLGLDEKLEAGHGLIIQTAPERSAFLALVVERFDAKASEYRALAAGKKVRPKPP